MSVRDSELTDIQEWQPKKKKKKLYLNVHEIVPASYVAQSTYHNSSNTTQRSQIIRDVIVQKSDESTPDKKAFILPVKIASTVTSQRELRTPWDIHYRKRNTEFGKQRHKKYRERQKKIKHLQKTPSVSNNEFLTNLKDTADIDVPLPTEQPIPLHQRSQADDMNNNSSNT